jgi:hypothetical protein
MVGTSTGASNLGELQMKLRASFHGATVEAGRSYRASSQAPPDCCTDPGSGAAVKAVAREQEMFDRLYGKTDKDHVCQGRAGAYAQVDNYRRSPSQRCRRCVMPQRSPKSRT